MRLNRILSILSIFLFIFPAMTFAEKYSLEKMYEIAVKNREIVKAYKLKKKQADLGVKLEKGDYLPSFDASYTANKLDESSTFENEENSEFALSLTQNLFYGFKDKRELEISKLDRDMAGFSLTSIKQDISLEVATAVLAVYKAESQRKVAEDAFKAYAERYENTKLKYSVGVAKKRDLLIMKVEKDDAEQDLSQAENEVQKSLNSLKRITGQKINIADIDFSVFDKLPIFSPFEKYKNKMNNKRSDIKSLKAGIEKAGQSKLLAKASYYPKVDLMLAKRYTANEYSAFDSDGDDETRIQLKLGINLFDGMKKYRKIDQAELEKLWAKNQLSELEDSLSTSLENLLLDAKTAEKNLDVAKEGIKEAEENLRITELSFDKGVATATDVLDSIFYLSRARTNEIIAKAQIFGTWFQIKRLIVDYPQI
jgi:outer membrane protein TolC